MIKSSILIFFIIYSILIPQQTVQQECQNNLLLQKLELFIDSQSEEVQQNAQTHINNYKNTTPQVQDDLGQCTQFQGQNTCCTEQFVDAMEEVLLGFFEENSKSELKVQVGHAITQVKPALMECLNLDSEQELNSQLTDSDQLGDLERTDNILQGRTLRTQMRVQRGGVCGVCAEPEKWATYYKFNENTQNLEVQGEEDSIKKYQDAINSLNAEFTNNQKLFEYWLEKNESVFNTNDQCKDVRSKLQVVLDLDDTQSCDFEDFEVFAPGCIKNKFRTNEHVLLEEKEEDEQDGEKTEDDGESNDDDGVNDQNNNDDDQEQVKDGENDGENDQNNNNKDDDDDDENDEDEDGEKDQDDDGENGDNNKNNVNDDDDDEENDDDGENDQEKDGENEDNNQNNVNDDDDENEDGENNEIQVNDDATEDGEENMEDGENNENNTDDNNSRRILVEDVDYKIKVISNSLYGLQMYITDAKVEAALKVNGEEQNQSLPSITIDEQEVEVNQTKPDVKNNEEKEGSSWIIYILVALGLLAVIGIGAFLFIQYQKKKQDQLISYALDDFEKDIEIPMIKKEEKFSFSKKNKKSSMDDNNFELSDVPTYKSKKRNRTSKKKMDFEDDYKIENI